MGSYETSIKEYKECCSLMSKNPKTKTRKNIINRYEELIDLENIIQKTYEKTELVHIS